MLRLLIVIFFYGLITICPNPAFATDGASSEEESVNDFSSVFKFRLSPVLSENRVMLSFYLDKTRKVHFRILNTLGQVLAEKPFKKQTQGSYFLPIELKDFQQGTYFLELTVDGHTMTKPLVVE